MFRNNHPNNSLLYTKAMTFIQKNVAIANFLEKIPKDSSYFEKVNILKNIIDKREGNHDIFKDENCLMYLLYLIKNHQLEDDQALTLLIYLTGVQSKHDIEIIHINDERNKTFKEKYIDEVIKKAKKINIQIDRNKFNEAISKLNGVDAWMIIIKSPEGSNVFNLDQSKKEISFLNQTTEGVTACLHATEFKSVLSFEDNINRYCFPSVAIINTFVLQFNSHPIKHYPIFGIISLETLIRLHTLGYHPVQLHGGVFVKNNLEEAHNTRVSSFGILIHDLYHTYSGSLLSNEEHAYLYNTLIPELRLQIDILAKDINSCKSFTFVLQKLLNRLIDMDLGLYAHRIFSKDEDNSKVFFDKWLNYCYSKTTNYCHLSHFNLHTVIKFYYDLYASNLTSPILANELSKIEVFAPVAKAVKDTLSISQEEASQANIKAIQTFCKKPYVDWLEEFVLLLQASKTAEDFVANLQSQQMLYQALMKYGFFYIPGLSILNDGHFQEIQKLESIVINRVNCYTNPTNINAIHLPDEHDSKRRKLK